MRALFGFMYLLLFFSFILTSLFIVFHISRYALDRRLAFLALLLFLIVSSVLLATNVLLFLNLPLKELLPPSGFSNTY